MPTGARVKQFAWVDTAVGRCAVVWTNEGICGFSLPGATDAATLAHVRRRHGDASLARPSDWPDTVGQAMDHTRALLDGQRCDLSHIVLDMQGLPQFHQRVYLATRRILPGQVRTYGDLALELGDAGSARAVGQALGANPVAVIVPCHRVMAAAGGSGGFSAPGGLSTKFRLLSIEGAQVPGASSLFEP